MIFFIIHLKNDLYNFDHETTFKIKNEQYLTTQR